MPESTPTAETRQRALLVGLDTPQTRGAGWTVEESLTELALLADTAGAEVVGRVVQKRSEPDRATCIGPGKAEEIEAERAAGGFDLVIFDVELSPTQQRNLDRVLGCPVIDRTTLILEIFARRAHTREAIMQVEMAQLSFRITRLSGQGVDLSRLGGGIGTRGPGETKLEVDRRRIRERIAHLRQELAEVEEHRARLRADRTAKAAPVVALTGYTNAGKSTLHRAIAHSDVLAEDRLFATLDATARKVEPAEGEPYILVDTVGFIHRLPHHLVAAFRSTLAEVVSADLILHVVDAAHAKMVEQMETVAQVLNELGATKNPVLLVFNKVDALTETGAAGRLRALYPEAVLISALAGTGLTDLQEAVQQQLSSRRQTIEILVPYGLAGIVAQVHSHGRVITQEFRADGTYLKAELERGLAARVLARLSREALN